MLVDHFQHIENRIHSSRPEPPEDVAEDVPERFVPDADFAEWIRGTFIESRGPLANERHSHLVDATIGVLWTNVVNVRGQRQALATAEMPQCTGGAWKRGRFEQQMREWFSAVPDFVITFYAPDVEKLDDRSFCALVEHELCHCAQAIDRFGSPRFTRTGTPIFAIRGHDVEEFNDVVQRYGATSLELKQMIRDASKAPLIREQQITVACGTCAAMAA